MAGAGSLAAISAAQQGLPALAPALRQQFHLGLGAVGLVLGAVTFGFAVMMLPWGLAADRIGERTVIAAGMAAAAVCFGIGSLATNAGVLAVTLFAAGLCGSSAIAASGRAIVSAFPYQKRAAALGLRQMAVPLGGAAAAAALPSVAREHGLSTVLLILAAGCLTASILAFALLGDLRARARAKTTSGTWRSWPLATAASLLVVVQFSLLAFLVVYLQAHGLSTRTAAAVFVGVQVAGGVARLLCGRWSDRSGQRIIPLRHIAILTSIAAALSACGAAVAPTSCYIVLPVAAVIAMSWNGLANTAAAELAGPQRSGAAIGFQNALLAMAGALAPACFGGVVQASSWTVAFAALSVAAVAAAMTLSRVPDLR